MEEEGIQIDYNGSKKTLKGTLAIYPADNLAANAIGGFIENFQVTSSKNQYYIYLFKMYFNWLNKLLL